MCGRNRAHLANEHSLPASRQRTRRGADVFHRGAELDGKTVSVMRPFLLMALMCATAIPAACDSARAAASVIQFDVAPEAELLIDEIRFVIAKGTQLLVDDLLLYEPGNR